MSIPERRGHLALLTGLTLAVSAMAVGGYMLTTDEDLVDKRRGLYVAHTGLALSPLLAHGVVGEWGRGALFSIPPSLGAIGTYAWLQKNPATPVKSENGSFFAYPALTSLSIVGAAIGVFDAALVDERANELSLHADLGPQHGVVNLGGVW